MIVAYILIAILLLAVIFLFGAIQGLKKEIIALDKEQHEQNKEIMELMKRTLTINEMLLQHIEILQYLCDRDPILSRTKIPYTGPIGEA